MGLPDTLTHVIVLPNLGDTVCSLDNLRDKFPRLQFFTFGQVEAMVLCYVAVFLYE